MRLGECECDGERNWIWKRAGDVSLNAKVGYEHISDKDLALVEGLGDFYGEKAMVTRIAGDTLVETRCVTRDEEVAGEKVRCFCKANNVRSLVVRGKEYKGRCSSLDRLSGSTHGIGSQPLTVS